jgi:sugar phosphate isomerase/epimerase
MDRVLFACDQSNFHECLALARRHHTGLEIQSFAHPEVLDGHWRDLLQIYRQALKGFPGELSCHGAFYDLASGSPDRLVQAVARQRYLQNLNIAHELGARTVVFHANYLPQVHGPAYRASWSEYQRVFWSDLAERAEALDVNIAIENMWEPEPMLIGDVLDRVGSSHVQACVDVGHVHLYSKIAFGEWLKQLNSRLRYVHMNNNPGTSDEHRALDEGVIDYNRILPALRALDPRPVFSLEIESAAAIEKSLHFLELE